MTIVIQIAGFLFLFIIILLFSCDFLGHGVISNLDSEAKLQRINENPKKFRISVILLIIENKRRPSEVKEDILTFRNEFDEIKYGFQSVHEAMDYAQAHQL